jgi:predicted O-methyltransferase YrrM
MKGSNFTKVTRLLMHLVTHPHHILAYLSSGPFSEKSPLGRGLPWFSLSAIHFLDSFVSKSMNVFEYGSGGSTVYFANRAGSITSTEDNKNWLARVQTELAASGIANVALQYRPFDFHGAEDFKQSEYLHFIPDRSFDIIVIDGTEEDIPVRPTCFYHAESKVAPGGIIVVDDSWRYPELRSLNHAKSFREFRSIGPCRPGVTSTDVYFY